MTKGYKRMSKFSSLFFYIFKKMEEVEINQVVDLASFENCELVKRTKRIRADRQSYVIIVSVVLVFINKQGHLI
jgi:hypothetical protein